MTSANSQILDAEDVILTFYFLLLIQLSLWTNCIKQKLTVKTVSRVFYVFIKYISWTRVKDNEQHDGGSVQVTVQDAIRLRLPSVIGSGPDHSGTVFKKNQPGPCHCIPGSVPGEQAESAAQSDLITVGPSERLILFEPGRSSHTGSHLKSGEAEILNQRIIHGAPQSPISAFMCRYV